MHDLPEASVRQRLELRLGRLLIIMNTDRPEVTMGRQRHNDIEIVDTRVSRSHARIELRDGRFILIDHSTNGTYVKLNGRDDSLSLKRSELPLEGAGTINLGRKMIDRPSRTIYFNLMA
ncbi:FHA domain-containing protein [Desulfococcus sp.]|uniref:FHA domain-containing protein n=1 Tax=Desulfococcus sp. TaxID=2025834 RepID=UPI003592EA74